MLLNELPEDKKQFNIKLYTSLIEYIEQTATEHNTTATNVVRHAINLVRGIELLAKDITDLNRFTLDAELKINDECDEKIYAVAEEYGILFGDQTDDPVIDLTAFKNDQQYDEYCAKIKPFTHDRDLKLKKLESQATEAGYALLIKHADVVAYIPTLPESPLPF